MSCELTSNLNVVDIGRGPHNGRIACACVWICSLDHLCMAVPTSGTQLFTSQNVLIARPWARSLCNMISLSLSLSLSLSTFKVHTSFFLGSPFNFPSHIKLAHRTSLLLWCKLQTQSVFVQIFEFLKNHGWGSSF